MKKEWATRPEKIAEQWPGELEMFAWQDFVTAIPSPLFVVTGWKKNGKQNACLQSWASFVSASGGEFMCILGFASKGGHMIESLKETGCCVLNFPSKDVYDRCLATIGHNGFCEDEITASGLHAEPAVRVSAPRIAECFLHLECEFAWEREHFEGSGGAVVALRVVHVGMDDAYYDEKKRGRYGETGYLYNVMSPRNPETGEAGKDQIATLSVMARESWRGSAEKEE